MADAVAESVRRFGPVDVVLSCCSLFPEILNPGLKVYLFAVPLRRTFDVLDRKVDPRSMTFGPAGVAEICSVAKAKYVMPYAQGQQSTFGQPLESDGALVPLASMLADTKTRMVR